MLAVLRIRCGITNPEELTDAEVIEVFRDYLLVKKLENEALHDTWYNALIKFWNAISKKR